MKLNKWLYGMTALAMLAACSDKDILPEPGGNTSDEGSGYVGVQIQLPTVPSTRANDSFDDGVSSEYKLNDAVILLFQGTSEEDAVCQGAYELKRSQMNADKDDNKQITTQVTRVANVTGMTFATDKKLYALVIANGVSHDFYPGGNFFAAWMKKENGQGKTIQELQEYITKKALYTQAKPGEEYASDIVMTNSPLSTIAGGNNNPGTNVPRMPVLVEISNKVYPTEADALKSPAGTIHVERAVGKITCSQFTAGKGFTVTLGDDEYKIEVADVAWDMAQDMANSYMVRNTNRLPAGSTTGTNMWMWNYASANAGTFTAPAGKYRMLGHTGIPVDKVYVNGTETTATYYRPYFCQVPGYGIAKPENITDEQGNVTGSEPSTIKENKTFTKEKMDAKDAVKWTTKGAFYPRENTFPVEFMKYANTTRIGFWVTFKFTNTKTGLELDMSKNKDFFTKGLDRKTIYLRDEHQQDPRTSKIIATLAANTAIQTAFEAAMNKDNGGYKDLYLGDFLDITYNTDKLNKSGEIEIASITLKTDLTAAPYTSDKYNGLFIDAPNLTNVYNFEENLSTLNNLDQVYLYDGGKVFYEVRIKHFGDDLTPWTAGTNASTIEQSYGSATTRSANYLGRYGIVRNNWYDLNITDITKLGDPQDPAKWDGAWPDKPDDNKDEYIAVYLRVLSWAKRTQSVTF